MYEILETVLLQSIFGFIITAILLVLKPVTSRKFPAKWQYLVWVTVLISMIIPVYRFIPEKQVRKFDEITESRMKIPAIPQNSGQDAYTVTVNENDSMESKEVTSKHVKTDKFELTNVIFLVWLIGAAVFILFVLASYLIYILRLRKNSCFVTEEELLNEAKKELNIKRNIKVRITDKVKSPLLVGVFFPAIYIPKKKIAPENLRMVYLHELTHYKRKDLPVKWFSVFVNAIHWFNPLCYILCNNLSSACEFACDVAVTKKMSESDRKIYMKTILDLVEER